MTGERHARTLRTLPFLIAFCFVCLPAVAQYSGGTGTAEDPYQIWTPEQMNAIGDNPEDWDQHFKLMADIDLSGYPGDRFNLIGGYVKPFKGVFDGDGHVIANFMHASQSGYDVGLFVYVSGSNAAVKNLVLIDPNVTSSEAIATGTLIGYLGSGRVVNCDVLGGRVAGNNNVGGLAGSSTGTIENCYVSGSVCGQNYVGGLVGWSPRGTIINCHADADVTGYKAIGGLAGSSAATVHNCHASGAVRGTQYIGGLLGGAGGSVTACCAAGSVRGGTRSGGFAGHNGGVITDCYAIGDVAGTFNVGGLVGDNRGSLRNCYAVGDAGGNSSVGGLVGYNLCGSVTYCYSTGRVSGERYVGGLVGRDESGLVAASFWDVETSGLTVSAAGQGKETAELRTMASFFFWGACDNAGNWMLEENRDYPRLAWEGHPGQPIVTPSLSSLLPGVGTQDDPLLIATAEELHTVSLFSCEWDKHFRLTADIDLSAYKRAPIIIGTEQKPFRGGFDGDGYIISHFTAAMPSWHPGGEPGPVGLFGCVSDPNAEIRNLGLVDPNVVYRMPRSVGALVGHLHEGMVAQCYVTEGQVSARQSEAVGALVGGSNGLIRDCCAVARVSGRCAGGLLGDNTGTISGCDASGPVWSYSTAGGLVGSNAGTVSNCHASGSVWAGVSGGGLAGSNTRILVECYASGNVSADASAGGLTGWSAGIITDSFATGVVSDAEDAGGLVGRNYGLWQQSPYSYSGSIANCYATGTVSGSVAGGLVGRNGAGQSNANISCCYATGLVSSDTTCGGLVGVQGPGVVEFSFWDTQASGQATSASGAGKTTAEMQTAATFLDAGWDFVDETENGTDDIWWILEGQDYPRLGWERGDVSPLQIK
jgi:hypothetical protein